MQIFLNFHNTQFAVKCLIYTIHENFEMKSLNNISAHSISVRETYMYVSHVEKIMEISKLFYYILKYLGDLNK